MPPPPPAASVVLLTGASSGLGLAIARRLLAEVSFRLVLTARSDSMDRFAVNGIAENADVWLRPLDVSDPAARRSVVREIDERWGGVDVLINNAGVAFRTVIEHIDDLSWQQVMNVNCAAPMELARLVLPGMRARRRGRIINISSVGGMMAMPTMSLYSASKFALEGAAESLWYEVRPWDVHVSLVEPGFIHSESFRNTRYTDESRQAMDDSSADYHAHYHFMDGFIANQMKWSRATPERVASVVLKTMRRRHPPLRVPGTWDAHLFALLRRLIPRGLYHRILFCSLPHVREWGRPVGPADRSS